MVGETVSFCASGDVGVLWGHGSPLGWAAPIPAFPQRGKGPDIVADPVSMRVSRYFLLPEGQNAHP